MESHFICKSYLIIFQNTVHALLHTYGGDQPICGICLGTRSCHSSKCCWIWPVEDPQGHQNAYHGADISSQGKQQNPWEHDQGCMVHAQQFLTPKGTA